MYSYSMWEMQWIIIKTVQAVNMLLCGVSSVIETSSKHQWRGCSQIYTISIDSGVYLKPCAAKEQLATSLLWQCSSPAPVSMSHNSPGLLSGFVSLAFHAYELWSIHCKVRAATLTCHISFVHLIAQSHMSLVQIPVETSKYSWTAKLQ